MMSDSHLERRRRKRQHKRSRFGFSVKSLARDAVFLLVSVSVGLHLVLKDLEWVVQALK
jgi:hypothetical protein